MAQPSSCAHICCVCACAVVRCWPLQPSGLRLVPVCEWARHCCSYRRPPSPAHTVEVKGFSFLSLGLELCNPTFGQNIILFVCVWCWWGWGGDVDCVPDHGCEKYRSCKVFQNVRWVVLCCVMSAGMGWFPLRCVRCVRCCPAQLSP